MLGAHKALVNCLIGASGHFQGCTKREGTRAGPMGEYETDHIMEIWSCGLLLEAHPGTR